MSFVSHKGIQPASYEVSKVVYAEKQKIDVAGCNMNGELPAASTDVDVNLYVGKELHIFAATVSTTEGGKKTIAIDASGEFEMAITEGDAGILVVEPEFTSDEKVCVEITASAKTVSLKPDFVAAVLAAMAFAPEDSEGE